MNYYLKKIITSTGPKPFFKRSFPFKEFLLNQNCQYQIANSKKNNNKIFYVIRNLGAGLFSNVVLLSIS